MCHGARVEPRSATGTRCSASCVTSTALRVDGTSADSRSSASVALAGASRPVDICPDRSCRRWISSIASRAAGSSSGPSGSATVSRWFQAPRSAQGDGRPHPGGRRQPARRRGRELQDRDQERRQGHDAGEQEAEPAVRRPGVVGGDEDEQGRAVAGDREGDTRGGRRDRQQGEDHPVDRTLACRGQALEPGDHQVEDHDEQQPRQHLGDRVQLDGGRDRSGPRRRAGSCRTHPARESGRYGSPYEA